MRSVAARSTIPPVMRPLLVGPDGKPRCFWAGSAPEYLRYHDEEWGQPTDDDVRLFEKVCLEGFQAGLSWLTILRKRDAFRRAFAGFELEKVARFGARDVRRLLADAAIVRHRGKIESAINNARRACELRDERGSLAAYFWGFEPAPAARPRRLTLATLRRMSTTPESVALSKDLRKRGWTFVGPTTSYAFMQAVGIVNDHLDGCSFRARAERARRTFERPPAAATAATARGVTIPRPR
ncbi:3-methyladenine DNA glycosylase [Anaeromyxobacter oryzae]|uniref:3-methyladenine DNA glycosylase n=2 Tax=Anaeromyxobacter oryzae TaxID=2918170 RepID=A0ABN6MSY2_9BACT|nr:3-methyladenine DNA glycosylase [Anaeromyxobacter oryzae]